MERSIAQTRLWDVIAKLPEVSGASPPLPMFFLNVSIVSLKLVIRLVPLLQEQSSFSNEPILHFVSMAPMNM